MHERLQTTKAKRIKKLRSATVEPVLGTLVNFPGMRRVNTRGIAQANKCMLMAAAAYNLKKLLKWTGKKAQTNVQAMQESLSALFFGLCGRFRLNPFRMAEVNLERENIL